MSQTDEDRRVSVVKQFEKLDLEFNKELQNTVAYASKLCNAPYSSITLIDKDTQWIKVKKGINFDQTPRELAFCNQTIKGKQPLVIPDTKMDKRFSDHPHVTGKLKIRFYAGAPLITDEGHRIGTLCVMDHKPHILTIQQKLILKILSKHAITIMEMKLNINRLDRSFVDIKRLRESNSKNEITLRSMFESLTDAYFLFGPKGEVIDFNRAAYDFINDKYNIQLSYGCPMSDFLVETYKSTFNFNFKKALAGEKMQLERLADYGSKGKIWWDCVFEPVRNNLGVITGISYIARDITEKKLNIEMIIERNDLLSRIAEIQSHDYRGPVATILGLMSLIKDDNYVASKEYLMMMNETVMLLDEKIKEVISISDDLKFSPFQA